MSHVTTPIGCTRAQVCKLNISRRTLCFDFSFLTNYFIDVSTRPQSWANCSAHIAAADLPQGTRLNTNGAGDSFTAGFLIATMLRHNGKHGKTSRDAHPRGSHISPAKESSQAKRSPSQKMTPYTLYMKEKYVALKSQYKNDKKAIFTKCHEMWERESPEVKSLYERMAHDESEEVGSNISWSMSDYSDTRSGTSQEYADPPLQPLGSSYQSLSLESAIQFAGLVAAHHVNVGTRDMKSLNTAKLLKQAAIFPTGHEI